MRSYFFVLLFIPIICISQNIPKETNTIIVKGVNLKHIVESLEEKDFNVAYDGFSTISTIPKRISNHGIVFFTIKIKDSLAYMKGNFEGKEITPELFKNKESYGGHDLSGMFDYMNEIAKSFKGEISYSKQ
ncbi:MAG TPA: hypothetical protein VKT28_01055 [Puia sp.]|nr:hypothetical protein [Puia sp.]